MVLVGGIIIGLIIGTSGDVEEFACPCCNQSFDSALRLENHQYKEEHLFICSDCSVKFLTRDELDQHVASKHKTFPKPEVVSFCSICNQPFYSQEEFNEHNNKMHPFACPYDGCTMRFSTAKELNDHQKNKGHLFKCPHCSTKFFTADEVERHVARKHKPTPVPKPNPVPAPAPKPDPVPAPAPKPDPVPAPNPAPAQTFACNKCGKTFATKQERNAHRSECSGK